MRQIKINVPTSYPNDPVRIIDRAIDNLLVKLGAELKVDSITGSGGNLNDWKNRDLQLPDSRLLIIKLAKRKEKKDESSE